MDAVDAVSWREDTSASAGADLVDVTLLGRVSDRDRPMTDRRRRRS